MTRLLTRSAQVAFDFLALSLALWAAFFLRFEGVPPFDMFKRLMFVWPYAVATQYAILVLFGIPRFSWRYVGLREIRKIFFALAVAGAIFLVLRFVSEWGERYLGHARYAFVPIGIILIDFALAFLGISGLRVLRRIQGERAQSVRRRGNREAIRTVLIGAGQAGLLVAKELEQRPDLGVKPVCFLDDNPVKTGTVVHGIPVLGTTAQLAEVCEQKRAQQVLITIAEAPGKDIRRISEACRAQGLPTKIIPGIYEIVGGKVNLSRIRELDLEDLLGREPVQLDQTAVSGELRGQVVLVTGAGGSIGSELCRQVCRFDPSVLVLVEQAENSLFAIHRELLAAYPALELVPCIADICDEPRMRGVFQQYSPAVVFHAAAHKHVPMMEWNPDEAIKNNILGTRLLADLADEHGVGSFVMISTDKAVNPSSVMGVSKRVAELYAQALSQHSETRFVTVRFGNVLGSAGSVIPIFKEQVARGGPVTVTHPDMKRYFMTIPEACQLVLQAGSMGDGGEIFILDMGEPIRILDLARDLITLSGLVPDEDIAIEFTGTRPGEKLFEELAVDDENANKTRHPKIFVGKGTPRALDDIAASIAGLAAAVDGATPTDLRAQLIDIVPEYCPKPADSPFEPTDVEPTAVETSTPPLSTWAAPRISERH